MAHRVLKRIPMALAVAAALAAAPARAASLEASYLFRLSDLYGAIKMTWAGLALDPASREFYVNDRLLGEVRAPVELVVDRDRVYVAQGAMRGVSVFRVALREPASG
jgi:hypothetical protein